jgi:hypothetical protein
MNELYAIDPNAVTSPNQLLGIIEKFRASEGRFVAKFPDSWLDEIRAKVSKGSLENTRITEKLKFWTNSLLDVKTKYRSGDWLENAIQTQRDQQIFEMILTTRNIDSKFIVELGDVIDRHLIDLKDSREAYVPANAKSYSKVCEPLFKISEEIVLYDYKFSTRFKLPTGEIKLDWQRINVLEEFMKGMVSQGITKRFLIMFNEKTAMDFDDFIQTDLQEIASRFDPNNIIDVLYEFDDGKSLDSQHPRCIFSIKAGLRFDQGFQEFKTNDSNLVSWMNDISLKPFRMKFLKHFH